MSIGATSGRELLSETRFPLPSGCHQYTRACWFVYTFLLGSWAPWLVRWPDLTGQFSTTALIWVCRASQHFKGHLLWVLCLPLNCAAPSGGSAPPLIWTIITAKMIIEMQWWTLQGNHGLCKVNDLIQRFPDMIFLFSCSTLPTEKSLSRRLTTSEESGASLVSQGTSVFAPG